MKHPDLLPNESSLPYLQRALKGKYFDTGKLGVYELDEYIRFKDGEFVVVTGHANVGKTHTLMYLMLLQSYNQGKKWLIYSAENEVPSLKRKLIEFMVCKPIQGIDELTMHRKLDWINEYFQFIDGNRLFNAFALLEVMESIKNEWDYTGALIDPYNSLTTDQKKLGKTGMHEYHYEVASAVRVFAHKNNVTTIVNTHPVTEAMRKVHYKGHPYEGMPMPPMTSDIEGGGKWGNRADAVVIIHRYSQHETDWIYTHVHVRKVKEMETGGRVTPLETPLVMQSMIGNVGFKINGRNLLTQTKDEPTPLISPDDVPF
jgi:KaiC/GvpD/RAD55 family RecA-like ATPase